MPRVRSSFAPFALDYHKRAYVMLQLISQKRSKLLILAFIGSTKPLISSLPSLQIIVSLSNQNSAPNRAEQVNILLAPASPSLGELVSDCLTLPQPPTWRLLTPGKGAIAPKQSLLMRDDGRSRSDPVSLSNTAIFNPV